MTFKKRFKEQYKKYKSNPAKYLLDKIGAQSPDVYSADRIMQAQDGSGRRCDDFVLCNCTPRVTGIYVIEVKGTHQHIKDVKEQLQSGADFIKDCLSPKDRFDFMPVLVAKAISSSMRTPLRNAYIRLCDKKRYIEHVKFGASLETIKEDTEK